MSPSTPDFCGARRPREHLHWTQKNEPSAEVHHLRSSRGRLGFCGLVTAQSDARARAGERYACSAAPKQTGRLCMRELRLGEAGQAAAVRVLRGRRQGDHLGDHQPPLSAILLRRAYGHRAGIMDRPCPGRARAPYPSAAVRRGERQIRAGSVGGRRRGDRRGAQETRAEIGGVLLFRPRLAGSFLHVCAVRPHVWDQQPARQLQHVPREHIVRTAAEHRRTGRHCDARRLRAHRMSNVLRPQFRRQQPAYSASAARMRQARCAADRLQSAARARLRAVRQSAEPGGDAVRRLDPAQFRVPSGHCRWRQGRDHGNLQGRARARRCGQSGRARTRARCRLHRRTHPRLRCLRGGRARGRMARARNALRPHPLRHGGDGGGLLPRQDGDDRLRHGHDPAGQGSRTCRCW